MKGLLLMAEVLVLTFALGGRAQAQTQLTTTGVNYGSWNMVKWTQIDPEHGVGYLELMGIRVDDTGKGPFHNIATHLVMVLHVDKTGVKSDGYETHTDKDGDKVIWAISGTVIQGVDKGSAKVIAATGKFAGMEGTMEYVTQSLKSFPEGTGRTICKESMKLNLKKPLEQVSIK